MIITPPAQASRCRNARHRAPGLPDHWHLTCTLLANHGLPSAIAGHLAGKRQARISGSSELGRTATFRKNLIPKNSPIRLVPKNVIRTFAWSTCCTCVARNILERFGRPGNLRFSIAKSYNTLWCCFRDAPFGVEPRSNDLDVDRRVMLQTVFGPGFIA